jgi:integrase
LFFPAPTHELLARQFSGDIATPPREPPFGGVRCFPTERAFSHALDEAAGRTCRVDHAKAKTEFARVVGAAETNPLALLFVDSPLAAILLHPGILEVASLFADGCDAPGIERAELLLLLGFAGAFRRSELVALDVADLEENETGLLVSIRSSKTDQEGHGETIAIARGDIACPVKALRAWLDAAGIDAGPIFRPIDRHGNLLPSRLTAQSIARIVKVYAARAGFDASTFSGHSLRSGFLTSAAGKGASIFKMMDVSRHKSVDTLRGYVRDAELFKDHAGAGLL